jgi:hypothetical protein
MKTIPEFVDASDADFSMYQNLNLILELLKQAFSASDLDAIRRVIANKTGSR